MEREDLIQLCNDLLSCFFMCQNNKSSYEFTDSYVKDWCKARNLPDEVYDHFMHLIRWSRR